MFRFWLIAGLVCAGVLPAQATDTGSGGPTGRWLTANGGAVVQIDRCGPDLCGQIVGLALTAPNDPMPVDWQGRAQCGETILQTAPVNDGTATAWVGQVLDPRDGSVYHAKIGLDAQQHLVLHGYIGLPIFGQSQTWTAYDGRTAAGCRLAAAG